VLLDGRKYVQGDRQGIAAVFEGDDGLGARPHGRKEGLEFGAEGSSAAPTADPTDVMTGLAT